MIVQDLRKCFHLKTWVIRSGALTMEKFILIFLGWMNSGECNDEINVSVMPDIGQNNLCGCGCARRPALYFLKKTKAKLSLFPRPSELAPLYTASLRWTYSYEQQHFTISLGIHVHDRDTLNLTTRNFFFNRQFYLKMLFMSRRTQLEYTETNCKP